MQTPFLNAEWIYFLYLQYIHYIFPSLLAEGHVQKSYLSQDNIIKKHFHLLTDWINRTVLACPLGRFHWTLRPMCAMFLTPIRSQTAVRESLGAAQSPSGRDRQGNINLEDQEPEFCVFILLLLQVMSSHCKKIPFSKASSFCYYLRE